MKPLLLFALFVMAFIYYYWLMDRRAERLKDEETERFMVDEITEEYFVDEQ